MKTPSPPTPFSHRLLFWILACMGVATAVPCFLVEPIDALRELSRLEAVEKSKVTALEHKITQQRAISDALRSDPLVNARLAQRELGYRFLGDQALPLTPSSDPIDPAPVPVLEPSIPHWIEHLYPQRWAVLYRDEFTRQLILGMSLTLLVLALVIYDSSTRTSTLPQR